MEWGKTANRSIADEVAHGKADCNCLRLVPDAWVRDRSAGLGPAVGRALEGCAGVSRGRARVGGSCPRHRDSDAANARTGESCLARTTSAACGPRCGPPGASTGAAGGAIVRPLAEEQPAPAARGRLPCATGGGAHGPQGARPRRPQSPQTAPPIPAARPS